MDSDSPLTRRIRGNIIVALALFRYVPAAKRAREGTSLSDPTEVGEKFGPLKAILGTILAVYANREVRSQPP